MSEKFERDVKEQTNYIIIRARPNTRTPDPGIMKFILLEEASLLIITVLKIFKELMHFYFITIKAPL